jgi:hypothetical protein
MNSFMEQKVLIAVLLNNQGFWDKTLRLWNEQFRTFRKIAVPSSSVPPIHEKWVKYRLQLLLQNHTQEHADRVESVFNLRSDGGIK